MPVYDDDDIPLDLLVHYSPTEVAELKLLEMSRPTVYNWIGNGLIRVRIDERRRYRITAQEIERVRKQWRAKTPSQPLLIKQAIIREKNRAKGLTTRSRHTAEEMTRPMREGRREAIRRMLDPQRLLSEAEREAAVDAAIKAQLAMARAKKLEKALLVQQWRNNPA